METSPAMANLMHEALAAGVVEGVPPRVWKREAELLRVRRAAARDAVDLRPEQNHRVRAWSPSGAMVM